MLTCPGKSVFEGIVIGKISVYQKDQQKVRYEKIDDVDREVERFRAARIEAAQQLQNLYEKALREVGKAAAAIFEIHRMILEDKEYGKSVEEIICDQKVNAEYAAARTGDKFAEMFASMEDDYMRSREADVKDISERLILALKGEAAETVGINEPVILAADDLAPSEMVQLNRDMILCIVTAHGSVYSHTAILAKNMGIPAMIGCSIPLDESVDGRRAVVNGKDGCVYIDPDEKLLERMMLLQNEEAGKKELLQKLKGKENITLDGRRMILHANIESSEGIASVLQNDADGIGLFRSEFIYLEREDFPSEEEQFRIYKTAAEKMEGKPVIIRTLDIGADKKCAYFKMEEEENPAMGCRAIRICLTRPEILRTQLRALFRAAACGNISVIYPMITSVTEIHRIREIVSEVKNELKREGARFREPKQGIMIETPAAVMMSDELAKEADFFSIGTNDLTQYTLAIDRQNASLDAFYDPHHPAVLRMIRMVVDNAHKAGIWVGICGELGADTSLTRTFLEMGVDELSMSPECILPIRQIIRKTDLSGE